MHGVQSIISGEARDVHVARLRSYANSELDVSSDLKVLQHSFTQRRVLEIEGGCEHW